MATKEETKYLQCQVGDLVYAYEFGKVIYTYIVLAKDHRLKEGFNLSIYCIEHDIVYTKNGFPAEIDWRAQYRIVSSSQNANSGVTA